MFPKLKEKAVLHLVIFCSHNVSFKGTEFLLRKLKILPEQDKRIKHIKHGKNKGGSVARNTGIKASREKYIAFLDSDDE